MLYNYDYDRYDDGDVYEGDNGGVVVNCWSCEVPIDLDLHEVPEGDDTPCPICEGRLFSPGSDPEPNEDFCADC